MSTDDTETAEEYDDSYYDYLDEMDMVEYPGEPELVPITVDTVWTQGFRTIVAWAECHVCGRHFRHMGTDEGTARESVLGMLREHFDHHPL